MVNEQEQLVTVYRMARALRVPPEWLTAEAKAGRIPHVNAQGRLLFSVNAVQRVLAERAAREGLIEGAAS